MSKFQRRNRLLCVAALIVGCFLTDAGHAAAAKNPGAKAATKQSTAKQNGRRRTSAAVASANRRPGGGRASYERGMPYAARADMRMWRWLMSNESVVNSIR